MAEKKEHEFWEPTAEDAIVGNLLFDSTMLSLVATNLIPGAIRGAESSKVFDTVKDVALANNGAISYIALEKGLAGKGGKLLEYVAALQSSIMPVSRELMLDAVERVNNQYRLFNLRKMVEGMERKVVPGAEYKDIIADTITGLHSIEDSSSHLGKLDDMDTAVDDAIKALEQWKSGEFSRSLLSGFSSLDKVIGQLPSGELTVIAARPSMGKCISRGTKVVTCDGTLRAVEELKIGDRIMGPDSTPRNILSVTTGREMMYWVKQVHGIDYRVNGSHVLSLKRSKEWGKWQRGDIYNISVREAMPRLSGIRSRFKGYKVDIELPEHDTTIDPYFIGLWLGDGRSDTSAISSVDTEIVAYLNEYASQRGEYVSIGDINRPCPRYTITGGRTQTARDQSIQSELRRMGMLGNKHIPKSYLLNSRANRLALLAGIIDSDGHYPKYQVGPYEITMKNESLIKQIKFLCDTLGYRTSMSTREATIKETGYKCTVFRVRFNGNVDEIPVRVKRKQARKWTDDADWTLTGFSIEQDCVDDYYGFEIDGDGLFLLEDMTVTHNTALATQMAYNTAQRIASGEIDGGQVLIFSAEMASKDIVLRQACVQARINNHAVRSGTMTDEETAKVMSELENIRGLPMVIDPSSSPTIQDIFFKTTLLSTRSPVRLVILDYIELAGDTNSSEELRISNIGRGLKQIAKSMDIPVIGVSQLNREVEKRPDRMPHLSDLRYSGGIEQEAYLALLLFRPGYYEERGVELNKMYPPNICYVIIAKNRNGMVGSVPLYFEKESTMFGVADMQTIHLNESEPPARAGAF